MVNLTDDEFTGVFNDDETSAAVLVTTETCTKCRVLESQYSKELEGSDFVKYVLRRDSSEEAKSLLSQLGVTSAPFTVLKHRKFTKTTPWSDMAKLAEFLTSKPSSEDDVA